MELDEVPSVVGKTIPVKVYENFRFPVFYEGNVADHLQRLKEMKCREDDVFIIAYPKSGNHWLKEMVHMVQTQCAEYCPTDEPDFPIAGITMDRIDKLRSPRVFYSHFLFRHLPKEFTDRRGKVITIVRDFRDVVTSYYHFYRRVRFDLPWDEFLNFMTEGKLAYGCWFDWIENFENVVRENPDYPILVLKYEDLLKDLKGEIRRIADFLEVNLDENTLTKITEASRFDAMTNARKNNLLTTMDLAGKDDVIFRKGIKGDWKSMFTVAQYEKVKKLMMERRRIDSRFNYLDDEEFTKNII